MLFAIEPTFHAASAGMSPCMATATSWTFILALLSNWIGVEMAAMWGGARRLFGKTSLEAAAHSDQLAKLEPKPSAFLDNLTCFVIGISMMVVPATTSILTGLWFGSQGLKQPKAVEYAHCALGLLGLVKLGHSSFFSTSGEY